MLIVIIGPDGCGKTTIARGFGDSYSNYGYSSVDYYECNFHIIPKIKFFKKIVLNIFGIKHVNKNAFAEGEYLGGMKNKPNGVVKGLLLFFWYLLDYLFGNIKVLRNKKRNGLMIFTRYYYDYYYQRVHSGLPRKFYRIFEWLVPTPDLVIFLKGDSEEIFYRKPELSVEEIDRQNDAIINSLQGKSDFFIVDTGGGIQKTVDVVINIVRNSNAK